MSWRVVVISNRAKLDLKLNYMVIRSEETHKVFLNEIALLLIESTAVSLTVALLAELVKRKIKVIFCDEKRNPVSELLPYYGSYDCSAKIKAQIHWSNAVKEQVWTEIVKEKIRQQMLFLEESERPEADLLRGYLVNVEPNDASNREGHAAKVYFSALFGAGFPRSEDTNINAALKSFLSEEEWNAFAKEVSLRIYYVLLLENTMREQRFEWEKIKWVDRDLCEIIV